MTSSVDDADKLSQQICDEAQAATAVATNLSTQLFQQHFALHLANNNALNQLAHKLVNEQLDNVLVQIVGVKCSLSNDDNLLMADNQSSEQNVTFNESSSIERRHQFPDENSNVFQYQQVIDCCSEPTTSSNPIVSDESSAINDGSESINDLSELQRRLSRENLDRNQFLDENQMMDSTLLADQSSDHTIYSEINCSWRDQGVKSDKVSKDKSAPLNASVDDDDYHDLDEEKFVRDMLDAHNNLRMIHGVQPLKITDDLCDKARMWANKLSKRQYLTYADYAATGENATFFPAEFDGKKCVETWSMEALRYDYEMPGWQQGTNYFTQMIWRTTTEIGIGRALMPKEHRCTNIQCNRSLAEYNENNVKPEQRYAVVVCFYRPAGNSNKPGEFEKNVLRPATYRINEVPVDENR